MDSAKRRIIKLRVSVDGNKYIGHVQLPENMDRMSDLLNDRKPFLKIKNVSSYESIQKNSEFIINKEHIDYVQVLEETPLIAANKIAGKFYKIRVKTMNSEIQGHLFVPNNGEMPMDIVNDDRLFLSIKEAEIINTPERYTFLGISKRKICTVEVFQADSPQTVSVAS